MEEDEVVNINFVPCLCFVPRGVAKAKPDKVTLTKEELARVIADTKSQIREADGKDEDDEDDEDDDDMQALDEEGKTLANGETSTNFNLSNYDEEQTGPEMAIGDIAIIDDDADNDEEDSDAEDEIIKQTDNLILTGHVQEDCSMLEVYIYNEEEGSLYVHHDIILPAFPLCIEWINHDPGAETGNLVAIGSMDPVITVWDLDIQDSLEPLFKLGKKEKNKPRVGHTDAVLDLSWNKQFSHILASGSVDQTVLLWDLDACEAHTKITAFEEKVQSIAFQPLSAKSLLTGSCDGMVKLFDCTDTNDLNSSYKSWKLDSEVERVCWNIHDTNYFMAGSNSGLVHLFDIRNSDQPVWMHQCHDDEISGLDISREIPGMVVTTSADGYIKVWDFNLINEINLVYTQNGKIGRIQTTRISPNNPFTLAIGGDLKNKNFKVVDLNHEVIQEKFANRPRFNVESMES